LGHRNIENNHIGAQFGRGLQQSPPIGDDSNNVEFGLKKALAGFGNQLVIVGDNDPGAMAIFHDHFSQPSDSREVRN
jgi:hypothetical protein